MSLGRRFQNSRLPRLIVGKKALLGIPELLEIEGIWSICLVVGSSSFNAISISGELTEELANRGIRFEFYRHSGEPGPEEVDEAVRLIRREELKGVIGIGGGSVIDLAKAAAAICLQDGPTMDYLEGVGTKKPAGRRLPFIAAPTTSGTGSEATKNAVLSRVGEGGFKKSLRHDAFIPDVAILDPLATAPCPRSVTAASGLDAITQLLEAYVSSDANPVTDALAEAGLQNAGWAFEEVLREPSNLEAREAMALAAYFSGVCLANAGLGFVHGAASPAGAMRPIPHGTFCGLTLLPSVEETLPLLDPHDRSGAEATRKYRRAAEFLDPEAGSDADIVRRLADLTTVAALGSLSDYGFSPENLETIAEESGVKNHPAELDTNTKLRILKAAL
jgi:alcohol dehydrogenase